MGTTRWRVAGNLLDSRRVRGEKLNMSIRIWFVLTSIFVAGCAEKKVTLKMEMATTEDVVRAYEEVTGYEFAGGPVPLSEHRIGYEGEVTRKEGVKLLESMFVSLGTQVVRDDASKTFRVLSVSPVSAAAEERTPGAVTGDTIQRHLEEYQKELIRHDLPLLPVALPEKDIQELIREGYGADGAGTNTEVKTRPSQTNGPAVIRKGIPQLPVAFPEVEVP